MGRGSSAHFGNVLEKYNPPIGLPMHKVDADEMRRNTSHVGCVGAYPLQVARAGLVGVVFCDAGHLGRQIAPYSGASTARSAQIPSLLPLGRPGRLQGLRSELYSENLERSPQRPGVHSSRIGPIRGRNLTARQPRVSLSRGTQAGGYSHRLHDLGRIQQAGIILGLDAQAWETLY